VLTLDIVKGDSAEILPPILRGRAPKTGSEIALASKEMDRRGAGIGDRISLQDDATGRTAEVEVVGEVVLPPVLMELEPGHGGLMVHRAALDAFGVEIGGDIVAAESVYARLPSGSDPEQALSDLNTLLGGEGAQLYPIPRVEPQDLVDFGRVDRFPLILGIIVALLAAVTLVHVLASSVLRHRRDLATLAALGLRGREIRSVVAVQAGFFALLSLAFGIPVGLLAGHTAWVRYADGSGFIAVVQTPLIATAVVAAAAILVAELCGAFPAWVAGQTRASRLLRAE
jgi:ABC-type antimicrobial peptide transport system permease subunit